MQNIVFSRKEGYAEVTVGGAPLDIGPSLEVRQHSPTGPEWGYAGSGPSQCALAVLMLFTNKETAARYYQHFKRDWIEQLPYAGGTIPAQKIQAWVAAHVNLGSLDSESHR